MPFIIPPTTAPSIKKFTAKSDDLDTPVWNDSSTFFGQGSNPQPFKNRSEREQQKQKYQDDAKKSDNEYVRNITQKNDVNPDDKLINKLKFASNKSEIKSIVYKKLEDLTNLISSNLLQINELKSDYKKFEEKINLINSQIKTLDNANNNYYLNKEYYINIKNLLDTPVDIPETKDDSNCGCDRGECKCKDKSTTLTLKDIYDMSPEELARYLNKRKIFTLADLVEYFLKNY